MRNRVFVVVLNWRNGRDTVECLDSILAHGGETLAGIVICDNDSSDDSIMLIQHWAKGQGKALPEYVWNGNAFIPQVGCSVADKAVPRGGCVLVHTGANRGFAGGNNVGIEFIMRFCDYDQILLLNNDALLTPGALVAMARRFSEPDVGMCGCTVVYHHTPDRVQAFGGARFQPWLGRARHIGAGALVAQSRDRARVEAELDYIMGAALMVSRACLDSVGLLDERYFLSYEEIDWATRARRKGFRLAYAEDAVVLHKEGGTIGSSSDKSRRSLLSEYYLVRSRLRFTLKFHPYYLPSVTAFTLLQISRSLLRGDYRRFRTGLRALFGRPFDVEAE